MNKNKLYLVVGVVLWVIILFLAYALPVQAEDEIPDMGEIGLCIESNAVNYVGQDMISTLKEAGFRVVNDGSCYYIKCVDAGGPGAYFCDESTANDQNYWDWVYELLPGMTYGPAYYGKLIDIGGCTDPNALNWMDPQWWVDYNIINDGSCIYPEFEELYPENAL